MEGGKKLKSILFYTPDNYRDARICTDLLIFTWFEWNADDADLADFKNLTLILLLSFTTLLLPFNHVIHH